MPVHAYTNWNKRESDHEEQVEPFRKYFFICEGANTETFYFKKLIDLRKELGIHPLIDIRLWEKTGQDKDIFEKKVKGYDELIKQIEESDIAAVTNPGFELFLLLHIDGSYEQYILGHEVEFLTQDEKGSYSYAYRVLHDVTGMNAKRNPMIGDLAENVLSAISQEKKINQDIHHCKGVVTSNVGSVIESIMNEKPKI